MVSIDNSSLHTDTLTHSLSLLVWSESQQSLVTVLRSSDELGDLSEWCCHYDNIVHVVLVVLAGVKVSWNAQERRSRPINSQCWMPLQNFTKLKKNNMKSCLIHSVDCW